MTAPEKTTCPCCGKEIRAGEESMHGELPPVDLERIRRREENLRRYLEESHGETCNLCGLTIQPWDEMIRRRQEAEQEQQLGPPPSNYCRHCTSCGLPGKSCRFCGCPANPWERGVHQECYEVAKVNGEYVDLFFDDQFDGQDERDDRPGW